MSIEFVEKKRWLFLGLPFTFTKYVIKEDMITVARDNYISGNSYTWCPCCGKCYILSEEEVVNAMDNDLSVYAECSCGNSFYIETEDEQDNYSEW